MSIAFEKMKVAELKKLTADYGIKKEDIEGSGVNGRILGTDYVRVLNEYVLKKNRKKSTKTTKKEPIQTTKKATTKTKTTKKEQIKATTKKAKVTQKEPETKKAKKTYKSISDSEKATESTESDKRSKTKSFDSEKTITMEEETIQEEINKLKIQQLRNAFIECILK